MKKPIQLVINNVVAPTTTRDRYQSYGVEHKELLTMADRSTVEELVGIVQRVAYSYDKMPDETYRALLNELRGGGVKRVSYLPDDGSEELVASEFFVESITPASLQFYLDGKPCWHNFGFTLLEVRPHA